MCVRVHTAVFAYVVWIHLGIIPTGLEYEPRSLIPFVYNT
jgi:hypothetical protein